MCQLHSCPRLELLRKIVYKLRRLVGSVHRIETEAAVSARLLDSAERKGVKNGSSANETDS